MSARMCVMYFDGVLNKENAYIYWAVQWRCLWHRGGRLSENKNTLGFLPTFLCRCVFCRKCPLGSTS